MKRTSILFATVVALVLLLCMAMPAAAVNCSAVVAGSVDRDNGDLAVTASLSSSGLQSQCAQVSESF